jgi:mannose-6-phosphate isomerase-like protein (cupin superfamily)
MRNFLIAGAALALACASGVAQSPDANPLTASRVFAYSDMTARTAPSGAVGRHAFTGTLATGETVAVHETTQPAGMPPNPAHRIQHSELIIVQEGTLEYMHDGKTERADAGSVIYVALGTLHAVRNIGDGAAKYVVVQIGGDVKK